MNDFTDRDKVSAQHRLLIANQFRYQIEKEKMKDLKNNFRSIVRDFIVCFLVFVIACFIMYLPVLLSNN